MMKQTIRKEILNLKSRQGWKKSLYFVCEGLRCCHEAISRHSDWVEAVILAESYDGQPESFRPANTVTVADSEFAELANTENPQGIMMLMRRPDASQFPDTLESTVLVLDRLSDPGNVGAILRTAWAMGFSTVVWTKGTCHPFNAKAIRAGMGAQFVLNLPSVPSVTELAERYPERTVWLTSPRADVSCASPQFITRNSFVVLGNEAGGVAEVDGARYVRIPMPGDAESLNVAQAATIFMYEIVRGDSDG